MTESEKLQARLDKMKADGMVNFHIDIDVYGIAKRHQLPVKVEKDAFGFPHPYLSLESTEYTPNDIVEIVAGDVNAMLDAVENGETEIIGPAAPISNTPHTNVRIYAMLRRMGLSHHLALMEAQGFDFFF